jgi:hypothetical protein
MQGKTHYTLSPQEREAMVKWGLVRLSQGATCFNQKGHVCMCSTTDNECVWCWLEKK